ncbi:M23 family metallopeptidase [Sulfurimonas diazotrophicus]|uniref:M23 family metallopeptidase n=1 Tax=Sulfurimonas diazotrophicus TaxID=3131939 RepID=A0ABZ3HBV2_9BACT
MNTRFTVTIHDIDGVRQYSLHNIVKKVLLYAGAGLVTLIAAGVAFIVFLNASLNDIDEKKLQLEAHNAELRSSITAAELDLAAKQKELTTVSDRLDGIESLIGLAPDTETESSLLERVEIAQMTSVQRAALLQHIPNGSPVEYRGITSKFGYRTHPTLHRKEFHPGSDLRAPMNTPIHATADGVIEYAGLHSSSGYGRLIIVDNNYGFKTYFGHLNKISVKSGQYVRRGDVIGYTGNSGMSNGPHLHYEVRFIQRKLNPYWFIKWDLEHYATIFEKEKKVPWQSLVATITQDQHLQKLPSPTPVPPSSQLALYSKAK